MKIRGRDSPCIARFYRGIGISMVRKVASRPPAQKLKSIGAYAFAGCINLYDIELPNSLLHLEKYAFSGCKSLYTLKIPSKLQRISDYTFPNASALPK